MANNSSASIRPPPSSAASTALLRHSDDLSSSSRSRGVPPITFHYFSLLPGELRNMIWDRATRLCFAGLSSSYMHCVRPSLVPTSTLVHAHNGHRGIQIGPQTSFYDPHRLRDYDVELEDDSLPAYRIDCGLWAACKESRAAMLRRYLPPNRGNRSMVVLPVYHVGQDMVRQYDGFVALALWQAGNPEQEQGSDMICLRKGYFDIPIWMMAGHLNFLGRPLPNLALEYNPISLGWLRSSSDRLGPPYNLSNTVHPGERSDEEPIWNYIVQLASMTKCGKIWLLDYTLGLYRGRVSLGLSRYYGPDPKYWSGDDELQLLPKVSRDNAAAWHDKDSTYIEVRQTDQYSWASRQTRGRIPWDAAELVSVCPRRDLGVEIGVLACVDVGREKWLEWKAACH